MPLLDEWHSRPNDLILNKKPNVSTYLTYNISVAIPGIRRQVLQS